ncbi:hypothetical protein J6U76_09105 [bacterium]|nr:hypothetical protein [bacterium]
MNKLLIIPCFSAAWKSFSKWWLILCLVAAVPCLYSLFLVSGDIKASLKETREELQAFSEIMNDDSVDGMEKVEKLQRYLEDYQAKKKESVKEKKSFAILAGLVIVTIVLQVVLILYSKRATAKDDEEGRKDLNRGLARSLLLSLSYVVLAFVKLTPFVILFFPAAIVGIIFIFISPLLALLVFLLWFLGGLWFYSRWYFTDYIITETSANPFAALGESWSLTKGNQFAVWVLVLTAFILHIPAFFTLGLSTIPTRSFDFTLRATAYRQLKGEA